ncbi:MAG: glycosyltransferase family protein [Candidatus Dormibacteria bacterium]
MIRPPRGDLRSVLLYAHDTYGLGHLRRNLAIAGHLVERSPGLRVVLLSGSPVADRFALPSGVTLVRLPPVVKVGPEDYRSRDPRWSGGLVRRARTAIMVDVACRLRPDVFLVDHAPQGMQGELLPVFAALRAASPATRIALGLRDVVDAPDAVRRSWSEQGVYATLEEVFDRILVYGSRDLLDVGSAYRLPSALEAKLTYCGYLGRRPAPAVSPLPTPFILGTAGGGGDGAEVLSATLAASQALGLPSLVVTGPLMDAADRRRVESEAAAGTATSAVDFVADMAATMAAASVVVTMGGYNTLCELASIGTPTIVVPRVYPRREQEIRAHLFADRGVVRLVELGEGLAGRLQETLAAALAEGCSLTAPHLDLDGLSRLAEALEVEASRSSAQRSTFAAAVYTGERDMVTA